MRDDLFIPISFSVSTKCCCIGIHIAGPVSDSCDISRLEEDPFVLEMLFEFRHQEPDRI